MADVIREAIIKIGLEQIPAELKAPDISKAVEQTREYGKAVKEATGYQSEATKATNDKAEALEQAIAFHEKHIELTDKSAEATLRQYRANVQAVSGLLQLGRGLALLAASGDEDLQKVVQSIAAIQGGIDLFRGGVAVVEAVAKAHKAAAAAAALATEAELALAASNEIRTASSLKAVTAATALTVATLPLSTLLIGVTAAVAAGAALWALWGDEGESALERQNRLLGEQKDLFQQQSEMLDKQISQRRQLREFDEKIEGFRFFNDPAGLMDAMRKRAESSFTAGEGVDVANRVNNEAFRGNIGAQAASDILSINQSKLEDSVAAYEKYAEQVEKVRDVELERIRNAEQLVERQQRQVEQAQRQLDLENERVRSYRAQIGALDQIQRAELERLVGKIEGGGDLNRSELKRLSELGGRQVQGFVEGQFAGFDQGLAERLGKAIGESINQKQQEAESRANTEEAKLRTITGGATVEEFVSKLNSERKAIEENADTTLKQINSVLERLTVTLKRFDVRLDEFERDINSRVD